MVAIRVEDEVERARGIVDRAAEAEAKKERGGSIPMQLLLSEGKF